MQKKAGIYFNSAWFALVTGMIFLILGCNASEMGSTRDTRESVINQTGKAVAATIDSKPVRFATSKTGILDIRMETVYRQRYLEFPEPDSDVPVRVNPPVLRWPFTPGKNVLYDVRLAREKDFSQPARILGRTSSPWAMFHPHQKLEEGTWYWQYRVSGKEWSEIYHFMIDSSTLPMPTPPASEFLKAIPREHPRVLVDKSEIPVIRNRKDEDDFQAIVKEAEKALLIQLPDENEGLPRDDADNLVIELPDHLTEDEAAAYYREQARKMRQDASKRLGDYAKRIIMPLSKAYLLTGDERYAEKAIETALSVAEWDPKGVSAFQDFGDSRCMVSMAIAYDTFNPRLSDDQKEALIRSIQPRAARFYHDWSNRIEARLLSGHVWQHILHYHFLTALALFDDVPEASDWLQYSYEVFLARTPLLGGMDGGWAEGVSYFPMNVETVIDIPLYIKKYTGYDFINSHPWYWNQADWLIYHIPPGSSADGFADNTEEIFSPGSKYAAFSLELAKLTANPRAAWYFNEIFRYEDIDLSSESLLRWIRLTRTYDLELPEVPADFTLPNGRVFHDIGLVSMHTNPKDTPENLMVAMRSSPFGSYGHMLSDQNTFNLLYGGQRLFYRTGYKVTMQDPHRVGWYQNTRSQNGVLVNGAGQPYSTEAFGWIARFLQGQDLAYAKGDASNAFQSELTSEDYGVLKNKRHLLLLEPDVVVVYDELEAKEAVEWTWLIHSMEKLSIDTETGSFSASLDIADGVGRLWSSEEVSWELADTFAVPAVNWRGSRGPDGNIRTYDDDQWHLGATSKKGASTMRFFSVIRVAPGARLSELMQDEQNEGKVVLEVGTWSITASLDPTLPPGLLVKNRDSGTVFSSHGEVIEFEGRQYSGTYSSSSKLLELHDGIPVFQEVIDEMPYVMRQRRKNYEIPSLTK
jgi:hypothetical protein